MDLLVRVVRVNLQRLLPVVIRLAWWTLITSFRLMGLAMASVWVGVPNAVDKISDEWYSQAILFGLPDEWEEGFRAGSKAIAGIYILVGWVLLSYATVFLVNLIF